MEVNKTQISSFKSQVMKFFPLIILALILLLGAYLRLYRIQDYMTFLGDEGRDVLVVKRMLVDHKFTLLGPTASVGGFFLGPIYYYFMMPFLWLFHLNPVGPAVMVGLFGVATIFLVYLLGKKFFNTTVGLIAGFLYSLSPVIINYSHSSWNPNLVPFFATLLILFLYRLEVEKKHNSLFWIGIILGIGLQLHYLFSFLIILVLIEVFLMRKELVRRDTVLLFVGSLLAYSPFLLFEIRHQFPNTQMLIKFIFTSGDTGFSLLVFFGIIKDLINRLFVRLVAQNDQWLAYLSMLVAIFGVWHYQNKISKKTLRLFVLWLVVPILLFGLYKKSIYDYYLGIVFPIPFLLTALGVSALFNTKKIFIPLGIALVVFLGIMNWNARPFIYEPNRQLLQTETVAKYVLDKAGGKPFNFALITGQNSDHAYRYFFEIWGNPPVTIETEQVDPKRLTVTPQLLVICEIDNCQPLGSSLWEVAGFGRGEIEGSWKVSVLTVYKLHHFLGKI